MRETTRHRQAFDQYWRLGPDRSIERLHAALAAEGHAPTLRTLYVWSRQLHWQQRVNDLERDARAAADAVRVAAIREMQERQAKEALLLQQKGTEWLAATEAKDATPEAAIRAITEGARLERLARGEATDRTEAIGATAQQLEGLDDAELDHLLTLAEGLVAGEDQATPARSLGLGDGPSPGRDAPAAAPADAGGDRAG